MYFELIFYFFSKGWQLLLLEVLPQRLRHQVRGVRRLRRGRGRLRPGQDLLPGLLRLQRLPQTLSYRLECLTV